MLTQRAHWCLLWLAAVLVLSGCATSSAIQQARFEFDRGASNAALQTLADAKVAERDRLLLLMDRGAIAFTAGELDVAVSALLEAADLVERWDLLRVSEQATTLLTSDRASRYRGEYSERLWIHTYLMMAFLQLGDAEAAAVEARRALQVMEPHESVLRFDWFTRALMALSFEAAGAYDSAQVEYRKLLADPDYAGQWDRVTERVRTGQAGGELVLFVQSGDIDHKQPGDIAVDLNLRIAFPFYAVSSTSTPSFSVSANADPVDFDQISTDTVQINARSLSDRGARLAAKQATRLVAKNVLAEAAFKENEALGHLVQLVAFLTEQADTRSWETLPAGLTLIRVPLEPGTYDVTLQSRRAGVEYETVLEAVSILPGGLQFAAVRH